MHRPGPNIGADRLQGSDAVGEEVAVPVNDAVQLIQKEGGFFAGAKAKDRQGRKNCPDGPALRSSRRYRLAATVLKVLVRLPPTDEIIAIAATAISAAIRPYSIAVTPRSFSMRRRKMIKYRIFEPKLQRIAGDLRHDLL